MRPIMDNYIDINEVRMEESEEPVLTHAFKTAWKALRSLRASIEIYEER